MLGGVVDPLEAPDSRIFTCARSDWLRIAAETMGKVRPADAAEPQSACGDGSAVHKKKTRHNSSSKEERKKWREMKLLKQLEKHKQLKESATAPLPFPPASAAAGGVSHTLALAVPGSILENAQSRELRSYLAGQIARAAAIFCFDEVVVFNDQGTTALRPGAAGEPLRPPDCCQQLSRILEYMECPQYLRKQLFPVHEDLRFAGLLNPLDCPHHLRRAETSEFREGVVTEQPPAKDKYSLVDIGLQREVRADRLLPAGARVTLRLDPGGRRGQAVPPRTPRLQAGTYWGYSVRVALSLGDVFTRAPHAGGYDLLIGTSDKGQSLKTACGGGGRLPAFKHLLVVFGGVQGLEAALENDERLTLDDPADLFDLYVNSCPGQGSRTIRTEEAVMITLAALQPLLAPASAERTPADETGAEHVPAEP